MIKIVKQDFILDIQFLTGQNSINQQEKSMLLYIVLKIFMHNQYFVLV